MQEWKRWKYTLSPPTGKSQVSRGSSTNKHVDVADQRKSKMGFVYEIIAYCVVNFTNPNYFDLH